MKLKRRHAIGALVATTAAGMAAPAIAQSRVRLTASTRWPAADSGPGAMAPRISRRLNELSGGQIQLEITAETGAGPNAYAAISNGDVSVHFGQEEDWLNLNPAYGLFCNLPFGMTANEFEGWIYFGDGANVWARLAEQSGVMPFLAGDLGLIPSFIRSDISELTALTGLTASASGVAADLWRTMGVKIDTQAGVIVDDPLIDAAMIGQNGLRILSPSVSHPHHALSANFNLPAFEALSEEHKGLVQLAFRSEHMALRMDAENAKRQVPTTPAINVSPLVSTQMALATKELIAKIESGGPAASDALWSYQVHLEDARAWTEVSEGAYLDKRFGSVG